MPRNVLLLKASFSASQKGAIFNAQMTWPKLMGSVEARLAGTLAMALRDRAGASWLAGHTESGRGRWVIFFEALFLQRMRSRH